MEYRVEELATAAGVRVDTVRFYQGRGLIPAPRKVGRAAVYTDEHLGRVRRIRELLGQGFTLAQIRRMPGPQSSPGVPARDAETSLLEALVEQSVGERSFSRAELAVEAGIPEALIGAAVEGGLVEPLRVEGEDRFSSADVEMARAALSILGAGFPLRELLELAGDHARNVQTSADAAIDLFDAHVRKGGAGAEAGGAELITETFRALLPQVTRLVALHFQRTLVNRALERLRASGEKFELREALAAIESARLEVAWR